MKKHILGFAATAAFAILAAVPAEAHRQWLLPSPKVLSGDDVWETVDAAVSNDLFYFEHFPLRLDDVQAWAPDARAAKIENAATGRHHHPVDVHLTQKSKRRNPSREDMLTGGN